MKFLKQFAPTYFALFACLFIFYTQHSSCQEKTPQEQTPSKTAVNILAVLDKHIITPGTTVTLTHTFPAKLDFKGRSVYHKINQTGSMTKFTNGIFYLKPNDLQPFFLNADNGFPSHYGFENPPQKVPEIEPGKRGIKFEFAPVKLGIFEIASVWNGLNKERWESPPVAITVIPQRDKFGREIIKKEWLTDPN